MAIGPAVWLLWELEVAIDLLQRNLKFADIAMLLEIFLQNLRSSKYA